MKRPRFWHQGDVDLVVMPPMIFRLAGELYEHEELFRDEWVCVMRSDNPNVNETLTLDTYLEMPHVILRATAADRTRSVEERRLQALGLDVRELNVYATAPGFVPMLFMIPGSDALAMVHKRLYDAFSQILDIKAVQPPVEIPSVENHMFWSKRVAFDPAQLWLRDVFRNAAMRITDGAES